jgi:uncharacterized membrane protein YbhN (UPF0104 family)
VQPKRFSLRHKSIGQWIQLIGSLISAVLFVVLIARQNWQLTFQKLSSVPVYLWLASLLLVVLTMICNGLRWFALLRAQKVDIPLSEVWKIVFAGAFASNFLPSTIGGDAFRVVSLLRYTPNKALSLASVFVDRGLNVLGMLAFLPFAWITFGSPLQYLPGHSTLGSGFSAAAVWDKWWSRLIRFKNRAAESFAVWYRNPLSLLTAFSVSLFSDFVFFASIWLLAKGLGMPVTYVQVMGVTAITYLLTLLPISINGYGLREFLITTLYMQLGANVEQASVLALLSRFFLLVETLPGALWLSKILPAEKRASAVEVLAEPRRSDLS